MNKILLTILTLSLSTAFADYMVKVPLEQTQGGSLPNGSINISPIVQTEQWTPTTPFYSDWTNTSAPYDCTNWLPDPSGVTIGLLYTQTATDCSQDQTRTRQEREQETTTFAYRDVGAPQIENQVIITSDTRSAFGTKPSKDCNYSYHILNPVTKYHIEKNGFEHIFYWNDVFIGQYTFNSLDVSGLEFTVGAYKYTAGELKDVDSYLEYYEICRESI